jgi:hypothetical protein
VEGAIQLARDHPGADSEANLVRSFEVFRRIYDRLNQDVRLNEDMVEILTSANNFEILEWLHNNDYNLRGAFKPAIDAGRIDIVRFLEQSDFRPDIVDVANTSNPQFLTTYLPQYYNYPDAVANVALRFGNIGVLDVLKDKFNVIPNINVFINYYQRQSPQIKATLAPSVEWLRANGLISGFL